MFKLRTRTAALVVAGMFVAVGAGPGESGPTVVPRPMIESRPVLTLEAAHLAVSAALDEARRLDAGGAIAVVDDGGSLICLMRIDGTFPAAPEVATEKARTAARFHRATKDFEDAIKKGRTPLLGVSSMTPLEGGVPILVQGQVVGAVGVSGAHSSAEDVMIATYATDALAAALSQTTGTTADAQGTRR